MRTAITISVADNLERTVIVAMIAMWMMQTAIDEIVDVIAVRHGIMAAARAMNMILAVADMVRQRPAARRIDRADLDHMLVDVIAMRMMQVSIVKIVDVIAMAHGDVTTVGAMHMTVIGMVRKVASGHF